MLTPNVTYLEPAQGASSNDHATGGEQALPQHHAAETGQNLMAWDLLGGFRGPTGLSVRATIAIIHAKLTLLTLLMGVAMLAAIPAAASAEIPVVTFQPGTQQAATLYGYPWPNAPECTNGGACLNDTWGFSQGQCVSWVAYRIRQLNGPFASYPGPGWGSASNWRAEAQTLGMAVNGTPALGSVAWYSYGHVAYVEAVTSATSVEISEMNFDDANGFRVEWISPGNHWPDAFIHIHDLGQPIHTAVALIPHDGASGYVLDGYGGLHAFGNAPAATPSTTWPGWDIARAIAVVAPGKGYVLDGYGGLHPFGGAAALVDPTYWGWDIARGLALCSSGTGGYVLDGYGGLHPIGNAQPLSGSAYWSGWDIARGIVVNSTCSGGYVLDGYGGVHPFGNAPAVNASAYWSGWDIARSITLVTNTSGYVLDGYGGVHPFAATGTPTPRVLRNGLFDSASTDPFDALSYDSSTGTGIAVTRSYSNQIYWRATVR